MLKQEWSEDTLVNGTMPGLSHFIIYQLHYKIQLLIYHLMTEQVNRIINLMCFFYFEVYNT